MGRCTVCGLTRSSDEFRAGTVKFHQFPRHWPQEKWIEFAGLPHGSDVSRKFLCSRHFAPGQVLFLHNKTILKNGAIPCLYPPGEEVDHATYTRSVEEQLMKISNNHTLQMESLSGTKGYSYAFLQDEDPYEEIVETENWSEGEPTTEPTVYVKLVSSASNTDPSSENIYPVVESDPPQRTVWMSEPQEDTLGSVSTDPSPSVERDVFSAVQGMCRICGTKGRVLVPIMEAVSEDNVRVVEQIEAYLPLQISDGDQFPSEICVQCVNGLNSWHKLYIACVATDAVFHDILEKENKISLEENQDQNERFSDCNCVEYGEAVMEDVDSVHFDTDCKVRRQDKGCTETYSQDLSGYENVDDEVTYAHGDKDIGSIYLDTDGSTEYADALCLDNSLDREIEEEACEAAGSPGGAELTPNRYLSATGCISASECISAGSVRGSVNISSSKAPEEKSPCKYVKLLVDCSKPTQGENVDKTWAYLDFGNESVAPTAPEYLAKCAKVLYSTPNEEGEKEKDPSKLYQEIDRILKKLPPLGVKTKLIELIKCNSLPKGVYKIRTKIQHPSVPLKVPVPVELPALLGCQKKLIPCEWCSEPCDGVSGLKDHKLQCRDLPVLCEHCGKTLPRFRYLQHSYNVHHQRKIVQSQESSPPPKGNECSKCGKVFKFKKRMEHHRCVTPPPKQNKCDNCGKTYKSRKILERHACPYLPPCEECGVSFQRQLLYLEHQILHGFTPVHYCEICYKVFSRSDVLQFHLKSNKHAGYELEEREENSDKLTCKVCGIPFKDMASLVGHLNTQRECECPVCHTTVRNERLYLKHNTKCQRRVCKFCSKVFDHHYKCRIHERIHTGYRPFQCDVCGKSFTSKRLLISHKPVHLEPSCVCQLCGATFKWRKNLNAHIVYHHEGIKRVRLFKRKSKPSL